MAIYQLVHGFVVRSFAGQDAIIQHLERTVHWVDNLRPNADTALRCAAVAHDIERSEPDNANNRALRARPFRDAEALAYHQQRGAQIMGDYLQQQAVPRYQIERIQDLIRHHELGGSEDQNFIKDVDSLSFLENNLDYFIAQLLPKYGAAEVTAKFNWMYLRISDPSIQALAAPFYRRALTQLDHCAQ